MRANICLTGVPEGKEKKMSQEQRQNKFEEVKFIQF